MRVTEQVLSNQPTWSGVSLSGKAMLEWYFPTTMLYSANWGVDDGATLELKGNGNNDPASRFSATTVGFEGQLRWGETGKQKFSCAIGSAGVFGREFHWWMPMVDNKPSPAIAWTQFNKLIPSMPAKIKVFMYIPGSEMAWVNRSIANRFDNSSIQCIMEQ